MKKSAIATLLLSTMALTACNQEKAAEAETAVEAELKLETELQQQSYGMGASMGKFLDQRLDSQEQIDINLDRELVIKGFVDALTAEPKLDQATIEAVMNQLSSQVNTAQQAQSKLKAEENIAAGKAFLEKNAQRPEVKTTESGLQYEVVSEGEGAKPAASDRVKVHYAGTLIDGTEFDSSYKRGEPITFPLNGVIAGWTEGLQLMNTGSKYKFYIPSELAYGAQQRGQHITPNSTLVFEVELLEIETAAE